MNGNIFNSRGVHGATVIGSSIFSLRGEKLYDLRGTKIYKLSGELVGHLAHVGSSERRLDRATERTILEKGRPDCGIDMVSFFNRVWSQGGSLSELAKAPGTGPDNH